MAAIEGQEGGQRPAAPEAPVEGPVPARILIVDDVPANLLALEGVLEPLGQEVVRAASGEEALRHLLRGEFAVIVMDVQMPGMDGLETARLIRLRERTRCTPLIFVTAHSRDASFVMQGYCEGAVDYLLKPVDPLILRSKVGVFVELYQRGEQLRRQTLELVERKRAEEEMRRTAALEQQLLGIVSHNIRSPLQTIFANALIQLREGKLGEMQVRAFERILRAAERIRDAVDLLADFTRANIGGGIPLAPRRCDLHALCDQVAAAARARSPDREVRCEHPEGTLEGEWDPERLTQVLTQLVDNALKFGTPGTPVRLSVGPDGEDAVHLEVHNVGLPIPPERLPDLFQPFMRGDPSAPTALQGMGLGLYIAHEIVRAHGGRIDAQSSTEEGTALRLRLPRRAAHPPLPAPGSGG